MALRQCFAVCWIAMVVVALSSCGSGTLPTPLPAADKSAVGCPGGNQPCSGSVQVPQILVDGTDPATYGLPISCTLTAGNQAMNFDTVPSQPWFGSTPGNGSLEPNASTTISVNSVNAASVSNANFGSLGVSASGYAENNQIQVELNCNVAAAECTVAFSCNVKTNPLP